MPPRRPIAGEGHTRRNSVLVSNQRRDTRSEHDGEERGGAITWWYTAGCPDYAMERIRGGAEAMTRN
jgi:hypothetical protein